MNGEYLILWNDMGLQRLCKTLQDNKEEKTPDKTSMEKECSMLKLCFSFLFSFGVNGL